MRAFMMFLIWLTLLSIKDGVLDISKNIKCECKKVTNEVMK
jgi:hypothetical protein